MLDVDAHARVRGTGDQLGVRGVLQVLEELLQGAGTDEPCAVGLHPGGRGGLRGPLLAPEQGVGVGRSPQGVGGVADGPVAGAAAEVAAQGVQVETVGPALVVGRVLLADDRGAGLRPGGRLGGRAGGLALGPVVLGGHGADEARGAVAALGASPERHLLLDGVQRRRRAGAARGAEALCGDDLLTVEGGGGGQAGVDGGPPAASIAVRPGHQHRAGTALALGAALLGPGQSLAAQPVQQPGVRAEPVTAPGTTVDRHSDVAHACCSSVHATGRDLESGGSPGVPGALWRRTSAIRRCSPGR